MADATFQDGAEKPLRLWAQDTDDLTVLSSLAQDAVFPANEMTYQASKRRFAILLNRFRWEDQPKAERRNRPYERVQAVLTINDVQKVLTQGVERDKDTVLSLLNITFDPTEDGAGRIVLTFAGDGAIALDVECLDITLTDVTRPYIAPSKSAPKHPE